MTKVDPASPASRDANQTLLDEVDNYDLPGDEGPDHFKRVGRFQIHERIGAGSMGVVYLARDPELDRRVALKFLNPDRASDATTATERMRREARAMARLRHPGIVQIHETGTHEGQLFLAMEYVHGTTLQRWLETRAAELRDPDGPPAPLVLPPTRVVGWAIELFAALEHAHDNDVIHRDLKPGNIFMRRDADGSEHLMIADFGVAKIAGGSSGSATQSGTAIGTPMYMSPEQAAGMDIDARTDLFAAGLIITQLLTGDVPLRATTALDQIRVRAAMDIPPLPDVYPPELRLLCTELCERDREQRIGSARAAKERLESMALNWAGSGRWIDAIVPTEDYRLDVSLASVPEPMPVPEPSRPMALRSAARLTRLDSGTQTNETAGRDEPGWRRWVPALAVGAVLGGVFWWTKSSDRAAQTASPPAPETAAVAGPTPAEDPAEPEPEPAAKPEPKPAEDPVVAPEPDVGHAPDAPGLLDRLAQVNRADPETALPWAARHALLRELEADPRAAPYVDEHANLGLDLLQAGQAPEPCEAFATTLAAIEAAHDPSFVEILDRATLPTPGPACAGLKRRLAQVRRKLVRRGRPHPPRPTPEAGDPEPETTKPAVPEPGAVTPKLDG